MSKKLNIILKCRLQEVHISFLVLNWIPALFPENPPKKETDVRKKNKIIILDTFLSELDNFWFSKTLSASLMQLHSNSTAQTGRWQVWIDLGASGTEANWISKLPGLRHPDSFP